MAPGFTFLEDQGGNENARVYWYDTATRAVRMVTDGKGLNGGLPWGHDGRRVAFHGTGARWRQLRPRTSPSPANKFCRPRLVFNGFQKSWAVQGWSPDDTRLLIVNRVSANEGHLYVMDVATAQLTPVSEGKGVASISQAQFTADGRGVYVITNRDSEFEQLRRVDLVTGEAEILTSHIPWDIEGFDRSEDGHWLTWVANVDGMSRLTVINLASHAEVIPPLPDGQIGRIGFDRTGKKLAMTFESAQSPRDVFVLEVERNMLTRYTKSEVGAVDPLQFAPAELVRFPTFDRDKGKQRQIPAFVYRPGADSPNAAGPRPVIIDIHGGPESQAVPTFSPFTQFLVREMGFVVIEPNVRGSSGYGKTWLDLDNGEDREDAVKDIGALLVWIGAQRDLDAKRVFVYGGSYGGYMSLADHGELQRPPARRHRRGRHLELRHLPREHVRLSARPAPRGIRRRTPAAHACLSTKDIAIDQRRAHLEAAARGAGSQRPARAGDGITADGGEDPRARRRGLVPGGEGRRPRVPQEAEPRLLSEDDGDLPRAPARGEKEIEGSNVSSRKERNRRLERQLEERKK